MSVGGWIGRDIEKLRRDAGEVGETPGGRMRAIDLTKSCLYEEMRSIMEAGPGERDKEAYEQELRDILSELIDLDHRQAEAFDEACVAHFGF